MFRSNVRLLPVEYGTLVGQVYNRAQKQLGAQR